MIDVYQCEKIFVSRDEASGQVELIFRSNDEAEVVVELSPDQLADLIQKASGLLVQ